MLAQRTILAMDMSSLKSKSHLSHMIVSLLFIPCTKLSYKLNLTTINSPQ